MFFYKSNVVECFFLHVFNSHFTKYWDFSRLLFKLTGPDKLSFNVSLCFALVVKLLPNVLGQALGVNEVSPEVVALVSHATQECLRGLLERLIVIAEHRKAALKVQTDSRKVMYVLLPGFLFINLNLLNTV